MLGTYQSQNHRLAPTAHLTVTMSLLELTSQELKQTIDAAYASNPALDLAKFRLCPTCHRPFSSQGSCPVCSRPQSQSKDEPIVFVSPSTDFIPTSYRSDYDRPSDEWVAEVDDLPTHVMNQIAPELPTGDRLLAAHILTSLDEDGLLRSPLIEIARYHHVPLDRVQQVIWLIQHADPVGVGSANPQQALLVQLDFLEESHPVPQLARLVIQDHMDLLSRHAYQELGAILHIPVFEAREIARFISDNLNPYPARAHWGEARENPDTPHAYHNPDIIITRLNDTPETNLMVEIRSPYAGALRVNPMFRESLQQAPANQAEKWQEDLEQATLLVKCLQQRDNTLIRLMSRMVVLQRRFILEGDAYLSPITRAQMSLELSVHESTISRAVSSKSIQLPNKQIIPFSKLFDPSLHIRTALRRIIDQEARPLSDTELAELLKVAGYPVARRTVAKYRAMEGILPARFRNLQPMCCTP